MPTSGTGTGGAGTGGSGTGGAGTGGSGGGKVLGFADALLENGVIKLGFGYLNDVTSHYFESLNQSLNLTKAALEQQNKIYIANMELASKVLQNSLNVAVDGFSKSANEIASQSLKYRISEAKANIEAEKKKYILEKTFMTERMKAQGAMVSSFSDMINNYATNSFGLIQGLFDAQPGSGIKSIMEKIGQLGQDAGKILSGMAGIAGGGVSLGAQVGNESAKLFNTALKKNVSYSLEVMQYEKLKAEMIADHIEAAINSASDILEKYSDLYSNVLETVSKADTESHIQAVQMGWVGELGEYAEMFTEHMINTTRDLAQDFGKSTEELIAMQKAYIDESTRNVILSKEDYQSMLGIGRGFGLNDNETAQLFGSMNVFNTSAEHGESMLTNMYKSITKMGLSAGKFGKDLVNNLQKAQKYNFKGGLENMMKITQWAQQTRFNLDAATGFSDRLLNGTISEALEASAKLQVLGGAAAMYSDPIAMLYEAGADIGSLAKRQAAMFNDLQGTFNAKTGETEFSWYENYMIKQRAQAAGITEEDAKNMIRQRHKQSVINKELRGSGLSEEQKVAVSNAALYNTKTKQWEVTDVQGNKHTLDDVMADTNLIKSLMPDNKDDAMLKIAQDSLGFAEKQTRLQAYIASKFGASNYADIVDVSNQNLREEKKFYDDNSVETHINRMLENERHAEADAYIEQLDAHRNNMQGIENLFYKFMDFVHGYANGRYFEEELGNIYNTLSHAGPLEEPTRESGESEESFNRRMAEYEKRKGMGAFERYTYDVDKNMYQQALNDKLGTSLFDDLFYLRDENKRDWGLYAQYEEEGGTVNGISILPTRTIIGTDVRGAAKAIGTDVRDFAARSGTLTAIENIDVITEPILKEIKDLTFMKATGTIAIELAKKVTIMGIEGLSGLFDSIGDYIRGLRHPNSSSSGPTAQNNIIPASESTNGPVQPQNVNYDNYAENIHSDQANQPLTSNGYANVQYLAIADEVLSTPLSNEIGDLANSIERLNTSIERMQIGQTPLTIDNDVHISGSGLTLENVQQAVLASLNDSTFTAKLTKGLSVVSSDSYQFNGHSSIT